MDTSSIDPTGHRDVLSGLVEMAQSIEASIDGLLAARDGVLALAARVALSQASDADDADLQVRAVAAELGAALRVSDRTIQRRMVAAEVKVDRFPAVWAAQGAGRISAGHARVIVEAGERIEDLGARAAYADRMVAFAEGESPNRTRVVAERLAEQCQPRSLQERHSDAREQRGAWVKDLPDAMAEFGVYGPAVLVHAAFERLTGMGKVSRRLDRNPLPGCDNSGGEGAVPDPRTLSQRRADIALDLLLTGAPAGHDTPDGLLVAITIPVLTLMGTSLDLSRAMPAPSSAFGAAATAGSAFGPAVDTSRDCGTDCDAGEGTRRPGASDSGGPRGAGTPATAAHSTGIGLSSSPAAELTGRAPIDPATARMLAGAASGWDRVITHPISGELLVVDRYRPSEHLKRHLRARDERCRFPGCGMPVRESDLDHTLDAAYGGPTEDGNLSALCRRHHVLKHHSPWKVKQLGGGLLEWTSPTGRVYFDQPPPRNTVTFVPSDAGSSDRDPSDAWAALAEEFGTPF